MRQLMTFAAVAATLAFGVGTGPTQVRAASGPVVERGGHEAFFARPGRSSERVSANLQSETEVPAISSPAHGHFEAEISDDAVEYELSFEGLQGIVTQSHIHIAQPGVNGGIMAWLCRTAAPTPPPNFTNGPTCPAAPGGTVTGVIRPTDILAVNAQGIAAGEFEEFVDALKKGIAYANVHSSSFGGGEIRGQIVRGRHHGDDHHDHDR